MRTSGTVLLNARSVKLNGHHAVVNYSKDTNNETTTCRPFNYNFIGEQYRLESKYLTTSTSPHKYSAASICGFGYDAIAIDSSPYINNLCASTTNCTVSCWCNFFIFHSPSSRSEDDFPFKDKRGAFNVVYGTDTFMTMVDGSGQSSTGGFYDTYIYPFLQSIDFQRGASRTNLKNFTKVTVPDSTKMFYNGWHHYVFTRSGSLDRVFLDGIKQAEYSTNDYIPFPMLRTMFCRTYFDDLVIIEGDVLWTENFTPPSTFLLDPDYSVDDSQLSQRNVLVSSVNTSLLFPSKVKIKIY